MDLKAKQRLFKETIDRQKNSAWQTLVRKLYPDLGQGTEICKEITFVVTQECNLRCTYCYLHGKNSKHDMTLEGGKAIVDFILDKDRMREYIDADKTPFVILEFIGGEPLLKAKLINQIMKYFKEKALLLNHPWGENYMVSMTTNGLLYDHPEVQRLYNDNRNKISMTITIDGTKELHDSCRVDLSGNGSYDRVIKQLPLWKQRSHVPNTKLTICHENIDYLADSVIDLFENGIDVHANVVFENVLQNGDSYKFYAQLITLADRIIENEWYFYRYCSLFDDVLGSFAPKDNDHNFCGGNGAMLAFDAEGTMYPCLRYMPFSMSNKRPGISCGNIKEGFRLDTPEMVELCSITKSSQSPQKCMDCKVSAGCGWCSGFNYDAFGTPNKRATFLCQMHKARVLANEYYWNKVAKILDLPEYTKNVDLTEEEREDILYGTDNQ
jgi:uncharacterized protein